MSLLGGLLAAPPSLETAGCVPPCSVGQQVRSGLSQLWASLGELGLGNRGIFGIDPVLSHPLLGLLLNRFCLVLGFVHGL